MDRAAHDVWVLGELASVAFVAEHHDGRSFWSIVLWPSRAPPRGADTEDLEVVPADRHHRNHLALAVDTHGSYPPVVEH